MTNKQAQYIRDLAVKVNHAVGVYPRKNQVCIDGSKYMNGKQAIQYLKSLVS